MALAIELWFCFNRSVKHLVCNICWLAWSLISWTRTNNYLLEACQLCIIQFIRTNKTSTKLLTGNKRRKECLWFDIFCPITSYVTCYIFMNVLIWYIFLSTILLGKVKVWKVWSTKITNEFFRILMKLWSCFQWIKNYILTEFITEKRGGEHRRSPFWSNYNRKPLIKEYAELKQDRGEFGGDWRVLNDVCINHSISYKGCPNKMLTLSK